MVDLQPFAGPAHQSFHLQGGLRGALLVHGFPGTPAELRPLAETLVEAGWSARAPLLPGFGADIASLGNWGHRDWLASVKEAWQELQEHHEPAILMGYSMGGALAILLAAELKPDRLVLISPFLRFPGLLPLLVPLLRFVWPQVRPFQDARFDDPEVRARLSFSLPDVDLDDPRVQMAVRERFTLPTRTLHEILRTGGKALQAAGRVDVPVLIMQGEMDPIALPGETRRLVARLSAARVDYLTLSAGHDLINPNSPVFPHVSARLLAFLEGGR